MGRHKGHRQAWGPEVEPPAFADAEGLFGAEGREFFGREIEGFVEIRLLEHPLFEPRPVIERDAVSEFMAENGKSELGRPGAAIADWVRR